MTSDDQAFATYDLGPCNRIQAESVGLPGQRHFRLRADAQRGSALLWLEKEQLYDLAIAIKRLLNREVDYSAQQRPSFEPARSADYDFQVTRLAIGQKEDGASYLLLADMSGAPEDVNDEAATDEEVEAPSPTDLALHIDTEQLDALADEAFTVCASGRPRCPLCEAPMGPGGEHICARTNGHHKE
jgi:uncharacterized repeat protein (TIGR03847 family)